MVVSLLNLPLEHQEAIFSYLSLQELGSARGTCRGMRDAITSDLFLKAVFTRQLPKVLSAVDLQKARLWQVCVENYNMKIGRCRLHIFQRQGISHCTILENGYLASVENASTVSIVDLQNNTTVGQLVISPAEVTSLVQLLEAPTIALGCADGKIRFWDPGYEQISKELDVAQGDGEGGCAISSLVARPGGIAFCCNGRVIKVLDLKTDVLQEVFRRKPPTTGINALDVAENGALIFSCKGNATIRTWSERTGARDLVSVIRLTSVCCLGEKQIAIAGAAGVGIWDPVLYFQPTIARVGAEVLHMRALANKRIVVVLCRRDPHTEAKIWDLEKSECIVEVAKVNSFATRGAKLVFLSAPEAVMQEVMVFDFSSITPLPADDPAQSAP